MQVKIGWLMVALLSGLLVGSLTAYFCVRAEFRAEAVEKGHAQYRVVDSRGSVVFEWLDKGDVVPKVESSKEPAKK